MFDVLPPAIDWPIILPAILVIATGVLALVTEMLVPRRSNALIIVATLAGLLISAASIVRQFGYADATTFAEMALRDRAALVMQLILVGSCALAVLFSENYLREKRIAFGEFYPLLLWSTAGGMIMVSTTNLLMLFLGLEVLSIALYVMAGMSRNESKSEESAIKYFLLGAFASGFLLYGIALMYGATGSLQLETIGEAWARNDTTTHNLLIFGMGFLLIGLGFKAAFVPFHQWTPDVYQGAPTNVTAFMAAGSKVAAIGALLRIFDAAVPLRDVWLPAMFWIAIITMTVGNLVALVQKDVKRMLAYSSIANAGYVLVALLAHAKRPDMIGVQSTIFYLLGYALVTLGAFAVVSLTAKGGHEGTRFSEMNGLWKRSPLAAGILVLFMASLIGVPPTAGFFGKFYIFQDALAADLVPLAIVLAVNSAISVYYYLGLARSAFVEEETEPSDSPQPMSAGVFSTCTICAAGIVAIMFFIPSIMGYLSGSNP